MPQNISIFTVAKQAQCSIATVSNVLNDKGRVSTETRDVVLKVVKELGYRPNSVGRSLRLRRTETLGLLFYPSFAQLFRNPYYAEIMEGLEETLLKSGYHLLLAGYEASTRTSAIPDFLRRGKVDGMIFLGGFPSEIIRGFCELNTPLVLLDSNVEWPLDCVMSDGYSAEMKAVDYLVENGHREIVMLAYAGEDDAIDQRVNGFVASMKKNGLKHGVSQVIRESGSQDDLYAALKRRLQGPNPPTAVAAVNDRLAIAIIDRLAQDGISVPKQVSVIGFDDDAVGSHLPLTTFKVEKKRLGEIGAELILNRIEAPERPVTKLALPAELVVRDSVARVSA